MFARKRIAREAARRLIDAQRPDFTLEDWQGLESWLGADARHQAAYRSEARILGAALAMDAVRLAAPAASARSGKWLSGSIAAVFVSFLAFVFMDVPWEGMLDSAPVEYVTRIGQQRSFPLSDGSRVYLNTNTKIRVRESRYHVRIEMLSGEAAFNVVHDARRSFVVSASGVSIRDFGTTFTVHALGSREMTVLVSEGKVRVHCSPQNEGRSPLHERLCGADLEAGDDAAVSSGNIHLEHLDSTEMDRRLLWTQGVLEFRDESLGRVVEEFNRYRRRPLRIADPSLAAVRIGASIRVTDIDNIDSIAKALDLRAEASKTSPGEIDLLAAR